MPLAKGLQVMQARNFRVRISLFLVFASTPLHCSVYPKRTVEPVQCLQLGVHQKPRRTGNQRFQNRRVMQKKRSPSITSLQGAPVDHRPTAALSNLQVLHPPVLVSPAIQRHREPNGSIGTANEKMVSDTFSHEKLFLIKHKI